MPSIVRKISKFTKSEIDYLFHHVRRVVRTKACTILVAPRQKEDFGRVLVIASRKVGNAPERNLIRRRIKSIFYEEKLFALSLVFLLLAFKHLIILLFVNLKSFLLSRFQRAFKEMKKILSY